MTTTMKAWMAARNGSVEQQVQRDVQRHIDECQYNFVFSQVTAEFKDGVLTLYGKVPSFYLKQTLQEVIRDIEHVVQVANEVDVVCCNGLSSAQPR